MVMTRAQGSQRQVNFCKNKRLSLMAQLMTMAIRNTLKNDCGESALTSGTLFTSVMARTSLTKNTNSVGTSIPAAISKVRSASGVATNTPPSAAPPATALFPAMPNNAFVDWSLALGTSCVINPMAAGAILARCDWMPFCLSRETTTLLWRFDS